MPNTYGAVDANGIPVDAYTPPAAADSGFFGWLNNALSGGANTPENRAKVQAMLTDPNGTTFDQQIAQQKLAQDRAAVSNMRATGTGAPFAFGGGGPLSGNVTPNIVRGSINTPAAQGQGSFAPISSANAAPAPQAPAQPASLVPEDAFRLPGVDAYGGVAQSDAGVMTRAAAPSATYGFQDHQTAPAASPIDQSNLTDHIVGKTVEMVREQPGDSWHEKISRALSNLPSDPLFTVGLALMGQRPGQPIGEAVINGFRNAAAFQDRAMQNQQYATQQQQLATQQAAIKGFEPAKYKTAGDAYTALLRSGVDPKDAASVVGTAFPASEYQGFAAGSTVIDKRTGKVVAQIPTALSGDAKAIQDLTTTRDGFPVGSQQYTTYDNAIKKLAPANGVAAKPPTEYQSKSAAYESRATAANANLTSLENSDAYSVWGQATRQGLANLPGVGGLAGGIANSMTGVEGQSADQGQRDFVNAILRQESGATITPAEFENARKQYFAQPGDSKEVIAQKQQNRQRAIEGLHNSAGSAGFTQQSGGASGSGGAPAQITPNQAGAIAELRKRGKI